MALIKCNECGKDVSSKAMSCPNCGNPISKTNIQPENIPGKEIKIKKYEKIGGWLILVGFGLVLSIFLAIGTLIESSEMMTDPNLNALITPGTQAYHPGWETAIYVEIIGNSFFSLLYLGCTFYFFRKKKGFPSLYIFILIGNALFLLIDYSLAQKIPAIANDATIMNEERTKLYKQFWLCIVWVPYLLISKRVKGTFTH